MQMGMAFIAELSRALLYGPKGACYPYPYSMPAASTILRKFDVIYCRTTLQESCDECSEIFGCK